VPGDELENRVPVFFVSHSIELELRDGNWGGMVIIWGSWAAKPELWEPKLPGVNGSVSGQGRGLRQLNGQR
jgi:hypothetical protein